MTRNEFIEEFKKISKKYGFKLRKDNCIRSSNTKLDGYQMCPIEAVCHNKYQIKLCWPAASQKLDLSDCLIHQIVKSADCNIKTKLRKQLLEGIKNVST